MEEKNILRGKEIEIFDHGYTKQGACVRLLGGGNSGQSYMDGCKRPGKRTAPCRVYPLAGAKSLTKFTARKKNTIPCT